MYSTDPIWTRPFCGVQYRKNTSKGIHISISKYETITVAKYIDLYLYKHLNQSNFTESKEFVGSYEEAKSIAETWV